MSVELEIRDGSPWWMSPDLWVVPGSDPAGPSGDPLAGEMNYVWAQVRNNGRTGVTNATVRFYWADPSVGFDRTTAAAIGTSFVSLAPGEAADVLCLTPWIPEFVNGGHECILAEAFHTTDDPLPATPVFNVPTDRHVAQRNLSVIEAEAAEGAFAFFAFPFSIHNTERVDREYRVVVREAPLATLKPLAARMRLAKLGEGGKADRLQFGTERCPNRKSPGGGAGRELRLKVGGHRRVGRTLSGFVANGPVLLHVEQFRGETLVGGLSVLVLPPKQAGLPGIARTGFRTNDLGARQEGTP